MKFFAAQIIALLAAGSLAFPSQHEAGELVARDDPAQCSFTMPACLGGTAIGTTSCRCSGMHPLDGKTYCGLWQCSDTQIAVCGGDGTGCIWI